MFSLSGSWLVAIGLLGLLITCLAAGDAPSLLDAYLAAISLVVILALSILTFYLLRPPAVAPSTDPALAPATALPPTSSALTPIPASPPADPPATKVEPPSPLASIPAPEAAAQPDTPLIFISHSSGDNDFGYTLAADLEAALGPGSVWYDSAGGLKGGDVWWDRIVTELTDRPIFVVLLSPQALASAWVHDEIRLAWQQKNGERGKVIVPVLHQPCDPPAYVGMVQFVRFDNQSYETALPMLLDAVRAGETRMIRPQAVPTLRVGPPFQESDLPMPERFVGRVADLQWVEERLRQGGATGITAVRGMGGIGKTALAAVAVRELRWGAASLMAWRWSSAPRNATQDVSCGPFCYVSTSRARFPTTPRSPRWETWRGSALQPTRMPSLCWIMSSRI
jgi:hypothetical protein